MNKHSRILIVGHADAIEKSLADFFRSQGYAEVYSSSSLKVDFLDQSSVDRFFAKKKPEYVFLGSFRSGGIAANQKFAAEFLFENLECQNNVIHGAYKAGAKKLLYYGASCMYPAKAPQPIREESLLTGPLESTSEPYSVAKIAGAKLCETYHRQYGFKAIVAVPPTVYGPGSDTDLETAHVIGSLIAKFSRAVKTSDAQVEVWGSGKPRREFLFSEDFVAGSLFLMRHYDKPGVVNLGVGEDVSIKELALIIASAVGFKGRVVFDPTKPDGTFRKLMDSSQITRMGWKPKVSLEEGVRRTIKWYLDKGR